MYKPSQSILAVALLFGTAAGSAADLPPDYAQLNKALQEVIPGARPDHIGPSPVVGLYEVQYGPKVYYATLDGRFLIEGSIYDLQAKVDLTAQRVAKARIEAINKVGKENMIVYAAKGNTQPRHTITVFTDVDCPYCRLLLSRTDEYNALGITVRYLLYPRGAGDRSDFKKAESVWCATDRNAALMRATDTGAVELRTCDNPIARNIALGTSIGIRGTPTIVTDAGAMIPGYVPPAQLLRMLGEPNTAAAAK